MSKIAQAEAKAEASSGAGTILGLPWWAVAASVCGPLAAVFGLAKMGTIGVVVAAAILIIAVLAAVHHAEIIAHKVGEPFGTLVLAVAVTVIEVSLIVSLMLADSGDAAALARDTVFAAIMIILNGIVGLCLLAGGMAFGEQKFSLHGASAALTVLVALATLALVLPNFVTSAPREFYAPSQLIFVAIVSLILYGTFILVQTIRHRGHFVAEDDAPAHDSPEPTGAITIAAAVALVVGLVGVVLLAKGLAAIVETAVLAAGLPLAIVGVVIAALVLAPESLAALRAARRNQLQTSLNLALGSALATIGLTIPSVAVVSLVLGLPLSLGLGAKSMVLLFLSLFTVTLTLGTGRTTILGGVVHLVIFASYLFVTVIP